MRARQDGAIREKLDIKLLILYVLRRLPAAIDGEALSDLVLIDSGINYFTYKECLAELVEPSQAECTAEGYQITAKGSRNCEALQDSLPGAVRARAERGMKPVIQEMRRQQMILANHETAPGGVTFYLALSDGVGSFFDLKILAADEAQARRMERRFRLDAEKIYQKMVDELSR